MAECKYCGSETQLYVNNVPVCIECSEAIEKHEKSSALKSDRASNDKSAKKVSNGCES